MSAPEVVERPTPDPGGRGLGGRPRTRRSARNRRPRRVLQVAHRWAALVTGAMVLVVVLSGVALVLEPEIDRALHPHLYRSTETATPISGEQALAVVRRERPDFAVNDVIWNRGHWEIHGDDYRRRAHVDPGTGEFNGIGSHNGGVMGVLKNLHMCALSCPDYAGHVAFLEAKTPLLGNEDLTVGGLILAATGLVLIGLSLSGLVLWWPGIRRLARGLKIRRGKGRYATHYDVHKVVGFAAIPFLLMWAITGAGFELKQFEQAWYGLLPGDRPAEYQAMKSTPRPGRAVDHDEARERAQRALPGYRITSVSVPDPKEKTSAYSVWMSPRSGLDPSAHASWSGTTEIGVDRYSGQADVVYGGPKRPVSQQLWQDWQFYGHAGYFLNPWPRALWLIVGLAPLVLALTGITTWLIRRRKRRAKRRPPLAAT